MTLINYGLRFHHFGLAVRNPTAAMKVIRGLGYECSKEIYDPLQRVQLIWCSSSEMPAIELVSSAEMPSPLDPYLTEVSELIYHLCYSSSDIKKSVEAIKTDNVRVLPVAEPKPAILFNGALVGFYYLKGFGLVEIIETV